MRTGSLPLVRANRARSTTFVLGRIGLLLGLAVSQVGAEPAVTGIGVITAVQGQVTVVHPHAEGAIPAKIDDDVLFKDIIETQKESRTKALFDDESLLTVGEHSRVEITEYIYDPSQKKRSTVVKLVRGTLRVLISKMFEGSGSKFEIHTPSAVAAARGTYFVVWTQGDLSGVVNIGTSGRVLFTSGGQTVTLGPGEFTVAPPGVIPSAPAVFGGSGDFTPPGLSGMTPGRSGTAPGRSGNTPGQSDAPPPGQVGATPGQSGTTPGKSGTARGQGVQALAVQIVDQDPSILASVRAAIRGTELRDTPRAVPAIQAVPAIPARPGSQGTPATPATRATPAVPATPPSVISGSFPGKPPCGTPPCGGRPSVLPGPPIVPPGPPIVPPGPPIVPPGPPPNGRR